MTKQFSVPRGTADILPSEIPLWQQVETKARNLLKIYGFSEIRTPIYEDIGLFKRSLGQTSDVVNKQLLEIAAAGEEKKDNEYALRPEGTAAVVRSYIENRLDAKEGLSKLFYIGPMFRGERPQKGRLRQFHQIGLESIGPNTASPFLDAEMIGTSVRLLHEFGISKFTLKINSLGTQEDKENFSKLLREKLKSKLQELCEDCQSRFDRNVFRVLDCKNPGCRKVVDSFHFSNEHLSQPSRDYFKQVRDAVSSLSISYEFDPKLVRGLDYYTHTVFEFVGTSLGSQDALGAGGRYNNLVTDLGGPQAADAVGVAFGIERILLAMPQEHKPAVQGLDAFMVALGETAFKRAFVIMDFMRKGNISCDMISRPGASMKSQMRQADKQQARYVLILGEDEEKNQSVVVKNMSTGDQEMVGWDEVVEFLKKKINQG
jgi:histidyl-tRNA synthetase